MGAGELFGCHNQDMYTLERGLLERVFFVSGENGFIPTPQPEPGAIETTLRDFRAALLSLLPAMTPLTYQGFVNCYKGRKRRVYERAAASLDPTCAHLYMNGYPKVYKSLNEADAILSTFVKCEKINFTAKPDPAPRVIQPRSARYNVEVGRYLKPIEHLVYDAIGAVFGSTTVVKCLNADARGVLIANKWKKFLSPVAVGLDAKRFDQHISVEALKFEHTIYNSIYRDKDLALWLTWQIQNHGFGRTEEGTIEYKIDGCRMSGDMNTAMGNVILMCSMMWSYMREVGVKYEFVNDGDDCILIVEHRDLYKLDGLCDWFLRLGFEMEREAPVTVLEKVVFCQSQPVLCGEAYRMIRQPQPNISKDACSVAHIRTEEAWNYYRGAVATCGTSLAGDVPILGSFYSALGRGAEEARYSRKHAVDPSHEITGMMRLSKGMHHKRSPPSAQTRASFFKAFDYTPDRQVQIEQEYDQFQPVWQPVDSPVERFQFLYCLA